MTLYTAAVSCARNPERVASDLHSSLAQSTRFTARTRSAAHDLARLLPGVALLVAISIGATALSRHVSSLSPLMLAVVFGACIANAVDVPSVCDAGIAFGARHLLRAGVILLGLRLSLADLSQVGMGGVLGLVAVVIATFFGTQLIARALGMNRDFGLLLGSGYAICGASAIAAVNGVIEADEDETAYAIALVTLFGSLSIVVLYPLGQHLGLAPAAFGNWVGGSVHDVGQVVATASRSGDTALAAATVAKLTRVVMLAPVVAALSVWRRHRLFGSSDGSRRHAPAIPVFVAGFMVAVLIRSTGVLSPQVLETAAHAEKSLLILALAALGLGVRVSRLRLLGPRPLLAGVLAWALVATIAYAETLALGPR